MRDIVGFISCLVFTLIGLVFLTGVLRKWPILVNPPEDRCSYLFLKLKKYLGKNFLYYYFLVFSIIWILLAIFGMYLSF